MKFYVLVFLQLLYFSSSPLAAQSSESIIDEKRSYSCQFSDDIPSCVSSLKELEGTCTDVINDEPMPLFYYDQTCSPIIFTCNLKSKTETNLTKFRDIGLYRIKGSWRQWWNGDIPAEIRGPYGKKGGIFLFSRLIDNELSSYTLFEEHIFGEDSPCKAGSFSIRNLRSLPTRGDSGIVYSSGLNLLE